MNGKKAKLLLKSLSYHPNDGREYTTRVAKTVAVNTGRVNADGSPVVQWEQRKMTTVNGARNIYQALKKE